LIDYAIDLFAAFISYFFIHYFLRFIAEPYFIYHCHFSRDDFAAITPTLSLLIYAAIADCFSRFRHFF